MDGIDLHQMRYRSANEKVDIIYGLGQIQPDQGCDKHKENTRHSK